MYFSMQLFCTSGVADVQAVILQLDHSLALYKRKSSFRRWQLATQPQVTHGVGPSVEALRDLETAVQGVQLVPCWGGSGKKLWSETRMLRDAFGFEKKRGQCLTLSCCSFNLLEEKNFAKLKTKNKKN